MSPEWNGIKTQVGLPTGDFRERRVSDWEPIPGEENAYQRFLCETPSLGVGFQVVHDEWAYDEDGTVRRTIHEVRLIDGLE